MLKTKNTKAKYKFSVDTFLACSFFHSSRVICFSSSSLAAYKEIIFSHKKYAREDFLLVKTITSGRESDHSRRDKTELKLSSFDE